MFIALKTNKKRPDPFLSIWVGWNANGKIPLPIKFPVNLRQASAKIKLWNTCKCITGSADGNSFINTLF